MIDRGRSDNKVIRRLLNSCNAILQQLLWSGRKLGMMASQMFSSYQMTRSQGNEDHIKVMSLCPAAHDLKEGTFTGQYLAT